MGPRIILLINCILGIQLSIQKLMSFPFLTVQVLALLHKFHPLKMFLQVAEAYGGHFQPTLLYLDFKILAQRFSGLLQNLHARLISIAPFLVFAFSIPSPPSFFGKETMSQETRCILYFSLIEPQMKFLWVLSISFWILKGMAICYMMWVGILLRVALAKVVFSAIFRNLVFHSPNFIFILSRMN